MKGSFNMNIFEIALFIVPIALLALSVFLAVKKFSKSKSSKKRRDYVKKRLYFVGKNAKVDNI